MNRFYCDSSDVLGDKIVVADFDQVHHLKDVLRFKPGERAEIFDNRGNVYSVRLESISEKQAEFKVQEKKSGVNKPRQIQVTIACAIPKKSKIDDIIDRVTQLGVDRIIPLMSQRVIVRIEPDKGQQRRKRWEKIALSASKQSRRNTVPVVDPVTDFSGLIARSREFDLKLIPNLLGERKTLKEVLTGINPQNVLVLIGPEGDFTPGEIKSAIKAGFIPVTFGDSVLRVETACLYIASVLSYEFFSS